MARSIPETPAIRPTPHHLETVGIRERISKALAHQEYIKDFPRKYIPSLTQSPTSHRKMSAILKERDRVESALKVLFSGINPNGSSRDPNRDIDAESVPLMKEVNNLNRALHNAYVEFLRPLQQTSGIGAQPSTTMNPVKPSRKPSDTRDRDNWKTDSSSDDGDTSIREPSTTENHRLSAAVWSRISAQSNPFLTASEGPSNTGPADGPLQKSESGEKPAS
jgi:hypothetical protein